MFCDLRKAANKRHGTAKPSINIILPIVLQHQYTNIATPIKNQLSTSLFVCPPFCFHSGTAACFYILEHFCISHFLLHFILSHHLLHDILSHWQGSPCYWAGGADLPVLFVSQLSASVSTHPPHNKNKCCPHAGASTNLGHAPNPCLSLTNLNFETRLHMYPISKKAINKTPITPMIGDFVQHKN